MWPYTVRSVARQIICRRSKTCRAAQGAQSEVLGGGEERRLDDAALVGEGAVLVV